ncbi:MAG: Bax inhibitor-1/YccA family protein [Actinomycetes bacterium]|nr:Bax inhibitor-1/YccA family protein [Actinomycetota bacterium]
MRSSNPVLGRAFNQRGYAAFDPTKTHDSPETLENLYNAPAASSLRTGRMTIDDVVTRTGILFGVLVITGVIAWTLNFGVTMLMVGVFGGFILAMVNSFSKTVRPALVIAYAAFEGVALGTLSHVYNSAYPGIVSQAVIGTLAAFAGVLFAYRSGRIRVTPKFTRMMMGALIGYLVLGLVSMFAGMANVGGGLGFYGVSGLGLLLAFGGVALASFFLILDFDQIEQGIRQGVPEQESWRAAFGLMVTLVWLYMEILRLISILRGND